MHMFRNHLGELVEIPEVAATQAKNSFGELLDRVAVSGAVAITRHDTPKAVLLSFEEFESLSSARSSPSTLSAASSRACSNACRHRRPRRDWRRRSMPPRRSSDGPRWSRGLESPELHIDRVASRVRRGGHPIPEETIRRRYERSLLNLIQLLPSLAALRVYDNSDPAEPEAGEMPAPLLVLHLEAGRILGPEDLSQTPDWAKPIVAAVLQGRLG